MRIEVRPLSLKEVDSASSLFVEAIADDPFYVKCIPDEGVRLRMLSNLAPSTIRVALRDGKVSAGIDASLDPGRGTLLGVAIWYTPRCLFPRLLTLLREGFRQKIYVRHLVSLHRLSRVMKQLKKGHPKTPRHWYLAGLAVSALHRGKGIGRALLMEGVRKAEEEQCSVYLEASRKESIVFYKRFGFEVEKEIPFGPKLARGCWRPRL
jgi:ribosomal protein S18 acetylase RimI-like enzyme